MPEYATQLWGHATLSSHSGPQKEEFAHLIIYLIFENAHMHFKVSQETLLFFLPVGKK